MISPIIMITEKKLEIDNNNSVKVRDITYQFVVIKIHNYLIFISQLIRLNN